MSKSKEKLIADAERLRLQIADAEANLGHLKAKLARLEAQLTGEPVPSFGLDQLWKTALPIGRTRSSKQNCRIEWNRIPKHDRPTIQTAVDALKIWNRCEEWKKDGHAYVPGLHRWIKSRQWENLPEVSTRDVSARYRVPQKPVQQTAPEDIATQEDIADILSVLRPNRMNS